MRNSSAVSSVAGASDFACAESFKPYFSELLGIAKRVWPHTAVWHTPRGFRLGGHPRHPDLGHPQRHRYIFRERAAHRGGNVGKWQRGCQWEIRPGHRVTPILPPMVPYRPGPGRNRFFADYLFSPKPCFVAKLTAQDAVERMDRAGRGRKNGPRKAQSNHCPCRPQGLGKVTCLFAGCSFHPEASPAWPDSRSFFAAEQMLRSFGSACAGVASPGSPSRRCAAVCVCPKSGLTAQCAVVKIDCTKRIREHCIRMPLTIGFWFRRRPGS